MSPFAVVDAARTVATVKILPYALPQRVLEQAGAAVDNSQPAVEVIPLEPRRVALIVTGHSAGEQKTMASFESSLRRRLELLGSTLERVQFVANDGPLGAVRPLADAIRQYRGNTDLLLLAGETAIQDPLDIAPTSIVLAGGTVTCFGAPVDPGNLLLLAQLDAMPVVGLPGCARSPKRNIIDLILPRVLTGERISAEQIAALGVGGLLDDVPERPLPRHRI